MILDIIRLFINNTNTHKYIKYDHFSCMAGDFPAETQEVAGSAHIAGQMFA